MTATRCNVDHSLPVFRKPAAAALTGLVAGFHDLAVAIGILADLVVIVAGLTGFHAAIIVALLLAGSLTLFLWRHRALLVGAMARLRVILLSVPRRLRILVFVRHLYLLMKIAVACSGAASTAMAARRARRCEMQRP